MNRDYVGYFIAIASIVIGGYISWYYYDKSLQFKRPIFNADFLPQTVFDKKKEGALPIRVTREDGSPLAKSVYSANHLFWNAGNLPITAQDALTEVRISSPDPEMEILSATIARQSRSVVNCQVAKRGANDLALSFRILEQDDGCIVNVFYSGSQATKFSISAEILGVKKVEARTETVWDFVENQRSQKNSLGPILEGLVAILPWLLAVGFLGAYVKSRGVTRTTTLRSVFVVVVAGTVQFAAAEFLRQQTIMNSRTTVDTRTWSAPNAP